MIQFIIVISCLLVLSIVINVLLFRTKSKEKIVYIEKENNEIKEKIKENSNERKEIMSNPPSSDAELLSRLRKQNGRL